MKSLDESTLEALAELICGDDGPFYRKGWQLPRFFRNAGLNCPDHDGSTRKWWTLDRLREYNEDPLKIRQVIQRLANPKEYVGQADIVNKVINQLNQILAVEGQRVSLDGIAPKIIEISPTIPEPGTTKDLFAIPIPDFDRLVTDPSLASILESRWREVTKCIEAGAHLAAIILMGSILEGVLLAITTAYPKQANQAPAAPKDVSGKVKRFGEWTLSNLIDVAHDCGWLQTDAKKFSHVLREYRNLVHPWEQRARDEVPDEDTCRICWEVVRAAMNDIQNFKGS
jgi:hypothetical protein